VKFSSFIVLLLTIALALLLASRDVCAENPYEQSFGQGADISKLDGDAGLFADHYSLLTDRYDYGMTVVGAYAENCWGRFCVEAKLATALWKNDIGGNPDGEGLQNRSANKSWGSGDLIGGIKVKVHFWEW